MVAKKRKRSEEAGVAYWVGPADSVVVLKRGLQESQIEEAREAVKSETHDEAVGPEAG